MKKELVLTLKSRAEEVARSFSNPERSMNYNREVFEVNLIIPLSESTATVIFLKQPSGKKAVTFFYYINGGEGYWAFFFPTYDHLAGIKRMENILNEVEVFNFDKNF